MESPIRQAFAQLGFTGLQMSVWKQSAGNFEPSVMLGVVRAATSDASAAQLLATYNADLKPS